MLDNEQQFPLRMDIPSWYSDAPRPVPSMLDENEFDVDHGIECQLRGCLAPLAMIVVLWACLAGLACGAPRSGYGMLQGGNRNNALTAAQISHPSLSFFVLRDRWNKQEPQSNVFNFTYNAAQIRRCRKAGKGYIVSPMTGAGSTPSFVPGPRYNGCIVPWAPAIPDYYARFIYAQANTVVDGLKVKDDPLCIAVWCTGPTVPSQEAHLNGMEKAKGFSSVGIVSNWKQCISATRAAFPTKPGIFSVSGQSAVLKYQPQIIAAMELTFGNQAVFQHNSLGTQTNVNAAHHQVVLGQKRKGFRVGAEMVQPGNVAGLAKFPERDYAVLYPGDERDLAKVGAK